LVHHISPLSLHDALPIFDWMFKRYKLHRISGSVPVYQSGTLRFVERLGLKREGIRREAVLHKGFWMDMLELGILYSEFNEIYSKDRKSTRLNSSHVKISY